MKLLYGTSNPAKLRHMREMLKGLEIELIGLNDLGQALEPVEESGKDPLENAVLKARDYYRQTGLPVFSCDSGLYLEGVTEEEQPGVYVRRVGGRVLDDEEMILHYAGLARKYGGELKARYRNGIALVLGEGTWAAYDGEDIASSPFVLSAVPHERRNPGYPLDSISLEPDSKRYYLDVGPNRAFADSRQDEGFRRFFERALAAGSKRGS
ncbi:non-canonical purine NTP pyrophosphatase [Gorillibacterium sp. sgz5001074]|uniref:non-canonical purine NTP pyrophosphatase n=1 Tax=Gorillibacterium sp. sgz5001074 TaxID=3446695 RepID=UPI003F67838D